MNSLKYVALSLLAAGCLQASPLDLPSYIGGVTLISNNGFASASFPIYVLEPSQFVVNLAVNNFNAPLGNSPTCLKSCYSGVSIQGSLSIQGLYYYSLGKTGTYTCNADAYCSYDYLPSGLDRFFVPNASPGIYTLTLSIYTNKSGFGDYPPVTNTVSADLQVLSGAVSTVPEPAGLALIVVPLLALRYRYSRDQS